MRYLCIFVLLLIFKLNTMGRNAIIAAFGETKRASEWVKDSRCIISKAETLSIRVDEMGWDSEVALTKSFTKRKKIDFNDFSKGKKHGYLTCTGNVVKTKTNKYKAECVCVCGKKKMCTTSDLYNKVTKSCGCKKGKITHGLSNSFSGGKHPLYSIWTGMKYRCYTITNQSYPNYGGRGIGVCEIWRNNFIEFFNWAINNGWEYGLTLERNDVNKDYDPLNCKWITIGNQQGNKRTSVILDAFGEKKCIAYWSKDKRCAVSENGLRSRIKDGWDIEKAITTKSCRK